MFRITSALIALSLILILCYGCTKNTSMIQQITIEGIYIKDLGHPFSGPAIMTKEGYYRISGDCQAQINVLKNQTKIKVTGTVATQKRSIPEAGRFTEITEKIIYVNSLHIIE